MILGEGAGLRREVTALRPRPAPGVTETWAFGIQTVDPRRGRADPGLVARLTPRRCLALRVLPWRRVGAATLVLCADPAITRLHLAEIEGALGHVRLAHADAAALRAALARDAGRPLALGAERRVPGRWSCRTLPRLSLARTALAAAAALLAALVAAPLLVVAALTAVAAACLLLTSALKLATATATLRRDRRDDGAEVIPARLPVVSLLVPLYREERIATRLLQRIEALDYPRDRLDLCLVVEDDDAATQGALARTALPPWAQVIEVPEGTLRTKPRALNYGLGFARGDIVGIYDAEDAPAPDHLRRVAAGFARRGPEVACLQGALDFYNPRRNWIARCFTLEYGAWFRVMLPGLERLGLVIPLGGTTLFLRREAIERAGGWDAHNVTEDADLGLRLARMGLRTEVVGIATMEEANSRPWLWVKQRSRWLKGYAVTWAVHMRDPVALWRDLGPRRFAAMQVQFLGTVLGFALAPFLWSFWLVPLGLPHPLAPLLPPAMLVALSILFLASQVLDLGYAWLGARRAGRPDLAWWAPALSLYFPMATLAVWRALWEVAACPFRWDKTQHGLDEPEEEAPAARPAARAPQDVIGLATDLAARAAV